VFKTFHPSTPSAGSSFKGNKFFHGSNIDDDVGIPNKPLIISSSLIYPFFCEKIVYIFTITEMIALFHNVKNHTGMLPNQPC
jgi:hypothetical protein